MGSTFLEPFFYFHSNVYIVYSIQVYWKYRYIVTPQKIDFEILCFLWSWSPKSCFTKCMFMYVFSYVRGARAQTVRFNMKKLGGRFRVTTLPLTSNVKWVSFGGQIKSSLMRETVLLVKVFCYKKCTTLHLLARLSSRIAA